MSGNATYGGLVDTYSDVNVTNSTFNNDGMTGLYINSHYHHVTLDHVNANGNGEYGVGTLDSDVNAMNSVFNGNTRTGLIVYNSDGNNSLIHVVANGNGEHGISVEANNDISITDGEFLNNGWSGLYGYSQNGDVTLMNVTASGNTQDGASLGALGGNAFVTCSQFNSNGNYGVDAVDVNGPLSLVAVTFDGLNSSGDYAYNGSAQFNDTACTSASPAGGHHKKSQDDALYMIIARTQDQLPSLLDEGDVFGSAFMVVLTPEGARTANLVITLAFPIPEEMKDAELAVKLWNGSAWALMAGSDVMDGYFVITVPGPGTYVLVSE